MVTAVIAACKGDATDDGRAEIKRELTTHTLKSTGSPTAVGTDFEAAKPGISINGTSRPIAAGMVARLEQSKLAGKGNLRVEVDTTPTDPKPTGTLDVTLKVTAIFAHAPELTRLEATITGTLRHKATSPELLGNDLGSVIAGWLDAQELPENVGPALGPTRATQVAVGPPSCTLHEDKSVRCWERAPNALLFPALTGTTTLDAGNNYGVCGVRDNGRVWCMDVGKQAMAVREVCGIMNATNVSVGQDAACALLADGAVQCWGRKKDFFEPCGAGKPRMVDNVTGPDLATTLSVSAFSACALTKSGRVLCWKLDNELSAKPVKGIGKPTLIAAGFGVCGASGAQVTCITDAGQKRTYKLPEPVKKLVHTRGYCALGESGRVYCWTQDGTPKPLAAFGDIADLGGDITGICAVTRKGDVQCVEMTSSVGDLDREPTAVTF